MSKILIAKTVTRYAVQYGTGFIVNSIIQTHANPQRIDQKVGVAVASVAIGGAVAEAACAYSDRLIDEVVDAASNLKK